MAKKIVLNTDLIYPVGSIYLSVSSTNPKKLFGGTWEQIQGRFLIGVGTTTDARGDTVSVTAGLTGGERQHLLTTSEMPSHTHSFNKEFSNGIVAMRDGNGAGDGWDVYVRNSGANINYRRVMSVYGNLNTGGGSTHNNMPPYLGVYMWKRVS